PTGEDAHGPDYSTPVFLLPQLCNSTRAINSLPQDSKLFHLALNSQPPTYLRFCLNKPTRDSQPDTPRSFCAFLTGGFQFVALYPNVH
ncbi:hypothetical protein L3H50_08215, partial [Corynebacterium sp. MC-04]